jgi:uncharacterized protein YbjT (DUF2867 family)
MTSVLIIGANGQLARVATRVLLTHSEISLTLFLRNASRLKGQWPEDRVRIVQGDARDEDALAAAMRDQNVVYANLSGDMPAQARAIIAAMETVKLSRLIFVSSMGIYGEVSGETYGSILNPYRESAAAIESSSLDYTILRPAWLNDRDEVAYGSTRKGQTFRNASDTVSRASVADLIARLVFDPGLDVRQSLGIHHS